MSQSAAPSGQMPVLHLVGGFLGSGKTTAIIQAAKVLIARGMQVGVITNDQGKYLVDTAFFRLSDLPAVEVSGGCFCCNYDDLNNRLGELVRSARPDVIFAESVGSCADIVATVVKPLLDLASGEVAPVSFSVFGDARLLLRRMRNQEMPFSEDVVYIYDQQIEEAGLIVANKTDLLDQAQSVELAQRLAQRYPGRPVLFQTSLSPQGVSGWLDAMAVGRAAPPTRVLEMDYGRYAAGEASLAWMDQEIRLHVPDGRGKAAVTAMIEHLAFGLEQKSAGIGHLKFILRAQATEVKLSFPTLEEPGWQGRIPKLPGRQVDVLVNARAELPAAALQTLLRESLAGSLAQVEFLAGEAFHPKEPHPTHRYL
jgi:G3E family GTPase